MLKMFSVFEEFEQFNTQSTQPYAHDDVSSVQERCFANVCVIVLVRVDRAISPIAQGRRR